MSEPMPTPKGQTRPPPLDLAACEALMRGGSKSFFAASSLLPHHVRMPSVALYAFCRVADDAIDEHGDDPLAMDKLYARLDAIYAGEPGEIIEDRVMAMVVHRSYHHLIHHLYKDHSQKKHRHLRNKNTLFLVQVPLLNSSDHPSKYM